ncbi:MAG: hypothetical protein JXB06_00490 [Spirochaetales bacterium]|nr:hypothetical protein [Spirochaetales bacterium]
MHLTTRQIMYPEGDSREIEHTLSINQLVDINGYPLTPPLPTARMIVYRVFRIATENLKGEDITRYYLEQLWRDELEEHVL